MPSNDLADTELLAQVDLQYSRFGSRAERAAFALANLLASALIATAKYVDWIKIDEAPRVAEIE